MSNPHVELHIQDHGVITLELDAEKAPKTVANFLAYVENGHYNQTIFHRVIPGFMVQGGGMSVGMKEKSTGEKLENEQFHPQVQRALDQAVKPLKRYRCAACGFEAQHHFWHCPGCQAWDSYPPRRVEEL